MQRNDANTICRGRYWFVRDSLGICCAVFTWLLMLYAEFVISAVVLLSDIFLLDRTLFGLVNLIGFNVVFTLAMVAHLRCVFSEPGIVARNNFEEEVATGFEDGVTIRKCVKCESVKPERAHHCSVCNRCVHKMDHHCEWRARRMRVIFGVRFPDPDFLGHFFHCGFGQSADESQLSDRNPKLGSQNF